MSGRDREEIVVRCLEGMFDAMHTPELQERATEAMHDFSRYVLDAEVRRFGSKDAPIRRWPSTLFACYLEAIPRGLARDGATNTTRAEELLRTQLQDLCTMKNLQDANPAEVLSVLHNIANRFCMLCHEDTAIRKKAGCIGIKILTETPQLGARWVSERLVDVLRTLLHVLKAMPYDLDADVDAVYDVLAKALEVCGKEFASTDENALNVRGKTMTISGILFAEISNSNPIVRRVAQKCIALLVQLSGKTSVELLLPHRERMLTAIYTKPLRALPFNIQIGMIEAVRYCLSTQPPLPELNEELLRLLHEALALADADDNALLGRGNLRQGSLEIVRLRVACIKLLTASMPLTDFFSKQQQTRQK